jgi:hypothetical protein
MLVAVCLCAVQDAGYVSQMEDYYQVPAHNIIRLAAWDSTALLAMWDLDEFLMLPKSKTWSDLLHSGCMGETLAREYEATFPVSWVEVPSNASRDIGVLAKHGTVMKTLLQIPVKHIPYSWCNLHCKTVIVPSGPWNFFVHGSNQRHGARTMPCEAGRLLHFLSMWRKREPEHNQGVAQAFDISLYDTQACGKA